MDGGGFGASERSSEGGGICMQIAIILNWLLNEVCQLAGWWLASWVTSIGVRAHL